MGETGGSGASAWCSCIVGCYETTVSATTFNEIAGDDLIAIGELGRARIKKQRASAAHEMPEFGAGEGGGCPGEGRFGVFSLVAAAGEIYGGPPSKKGPEGGTVKGGEGRRSIQVEVLSLLQTFGGYHQSKPSPHLVRKPIRLCCTA